MSRTQVDNFIKILQVALDRELQPLEQLDWDTLIRYANAQSLTAVFYQGAARFPEFAKYPEVKRVVLQWKTIATVTMRTLRSQRFLDIYQQPTAGRLYPIVLKGILCRQLYDSLADYRPSCDEDLYISPQEISVCHLLLEQAGWKLESHPDSLTVPEKLQMISYKVNPQQLLEDIFDVDVFGQTRSGRGRGAILTIAAQYECTAKRWQRLLVPSVQQLEDGRP